MDSLAFAMLICDYFAGDVHEYGAEDLHIFVLLTNEWMLLLNHRTDPPEAYELVNIIIDKMADITQFTQQMQTKNCGCYFHIPWPARLWNTRQHHLPAFTADRHGAYLRLLHELEKSQANNLLTGPDVDVLPDLLRLAHDSYPGLCKDVECRRRSNAAVNSKRTVNRHDSAKYALPEFNTGLSATNTTIPFQISPPTCPDVVEAFNYALQVSNGAGNVTREQIRSLVKVWSLYSNPRTGYMERGRMMPFFAVSPQLQHGFLP